MKNLRHIILVLLTILPIALMAIPIINAPTTQNGTCKNDATITVNISGAGTHVTYGLKGKQDQILEIKSQLSNVFPDLPAGDYIISVYDNTTGSTPVTREVSVTTTYIDFAISVPDVTQNVCGGSIRLRVTGGRAPYLYRIKNLNDNNEIEFSSNSTTYLFNNLPAGKYYSEVVDNCGEMRVAHASDKTTIKEGVLKDVPFNTFEYKVGGYVQGSGSCNNIRFSIYYNQYYINGNTDIAITNQGEIEYRVEYPVGSGKYTSWNSGQGYHYINNYNEENPGKYIVEVKHPCTGVITKSPEYDMPAIINSFTSNTGSFVYDNFCTMPTVVKPYIRRSTTGITNYVCTKEYDLSITEKETGTTKTYTWNSTSNFYIPDAVPGHQYTITVLDNGVQQGQPIIITTSTPNSLAYSTYSVNTSGYNYGITGDFNTTAVSTSYTASNYYSINTTRPITYKIKSGPVTNRDAITIESGSSGTLWTDLPFGTYEFEAQHENCAIVSTVNLNKTVYGFDAMEPRFSESSVCGSYDIAYKGYFLNANNLPYTTSATSYYYVLKLTNLDKNTSTTYSSNYSNYEKNLTGILPGRYKLEYYSIYNSAQIIYKEQTITLPEYRAPSLYIPLSGGITCGDEEGTLTLETRGSRPPYLYRYKNYDENDDPTSNVGYGLWTSQNVFTGLRAGRFTVQISDNCGSVTRENIKIYSGTEQFVTLVGSFNENTVCQGKSGLISVLSIGPVESYQWYKNNVPIDGATTESYDIPDMQLEDEGTYKVVVNTGAGGCELSSEIRVRMLPMITTQNDSITVMPFEQRIFDVFANDSIAMCHPEVCDQILTPEKIQVEGYPVGVLEGEFGKIEFENNNIKFTAPESYDKGIVRFTYTVACMDNGVPYNGKGQVAIFILQSCTQPTICYGEGYNVCFNDYPAGRTSFIITDKNGPVTLPKIYNSLQEDEVLKVTPVVDGERFPTIDYTIYVIPQGATKVRWKGTTDHYWNNPKNWVTIKSNNTDGSPIKWVPNDCVDAEIPTGSPRYPILSTDASINNLFMKDRAMLAYSHKLTYNSVELDLKLSSTERDRWIMYSAPLAGMYTGDFMLRKNAGRILEEGVFMTFYQTKNPDDASTAKAKTITRTFANLEQKLPLGKSFFLQMDSNTENVSQYTFPREDSKYAYYNMNDWSSTFPSIVETKPLERSVKGRFIADINNILINKSYTVTPVDDMENSEVVMVNNPFPAYLNIKRFLEANSAVLEQGYYIWDGQENDLMKYNKGRGNTWTIQDSAPIKDYTVGENEYIAPFQSFFVVKKVKANKVSLIFKPEEMTTVEPVGISGDYILK